MNKKAIYRQLADFKLPSAPSDQEQREIVFEAIRLRNNYVRSFTDSPKAVQRLVRSFPKTERKYVNKLREYALRCARSHSRKNQAVLTRQIEIKPITSLRFLFRTNGDGITELEEPYSDFDRQKQVVVSRNLRLSASVAVREFKKMNIHPANSTFVGVEDLISFGGMGLGRAVDGYLLQRGAKFSTYAHRWIYQRITRELRKRLTFLAVPEYLLKTQSELKKKAERLSQEEFRRVRIEEILEPDDEADLIKHAEKANNVMPIESIVATESELLSTENSLGSKLGEDGFFREGIYLALERICQKARKDPRLAEVIIFRFGLFGHPVLSLAEIGNKLDISKQRINQLESKAKQFLREDEKFVRLASAYLNC